MKNIPNKIHLVLGADGGVEDFKTLQDVTWCSDKIYEDDLEFISVYSILAEIDRLKDYANSSDNYEEVEFCINVLKNLIK